MSGAPFGRLVSRTLVVPGENVDTDQIIPARFLTGTTRTGLGRHLFADWRFDAAGAARADSPFDGAAAPGCEILVAGRNFGCGSSREHAIWALADFGFRAVVAVDLADIFRRNALQNGLLAFTVPEEVHAALAAAPGAEVAIDLAAGELVFAGHSVPFAIEPFARHRLLRGQGELDYLLAQDDAIARFEAAHPLPALDLGGGVA